MFVISRPKVSVLQVSGSRVWLSTISTVRINVQVCSYLCLFHRSRCELHNFNDQPIWTSKC